MSDPTLFDLAPTRPAPTGIVHVLMPCMAYACGTGVLEAPGDRFQVGISDWAAVTCDECRAVGIDTIRAETGRQQGDQAGAA